jgi:GNAT superfamily N-acetyltransferase
MSTGRRLRDASSVQRGGLAGSSDRVTRTTWSADQILQASAAWISPWFPPQSVRVDLGWLEFYVVDGTATLKRVLPGDFSATELIKRVVTELRRRRVAEACWLVGPPFRPERVDQVLLDLGARVDSVIDICAYPLDGELLTELPADAATARPVRTRQDVADFERVNALAWGYPQPSETDIERAFASLCRGSFIGYWNGTPAGAGGYSLVGEVARLWGTAVVPELRGRGVYRALVRARLAEATSRGARLALVHAMRTTSAPILQRLGFEVYGQRTVLAFRPDAVAARLDAR